MLPESDGLWPRSAPDGPVPSRRLVAVVISVDDVLDPASDLHRVVGGATQVDVLVARVDSPVAERRPSPLETPDYPELDVEPAGGMPPGNVRLHHLGLRWGLQDADEPDMVAALSELIGFDPDQGVFCVGPVSGPTDPETVVVARAVRRVARVYGLPVLRYHPADVAGRIVGPSARPEPAR